MAVMKIKVDELDKRAITRAIARREAMGPMPDGDSGNNGAALAEICRGWEELLDFRKAERQKGN